MRALWPFFTFGKITISRPFAPQPPVFYKFRDVILNQVPTHGHKLRNDLCRGIPRVWRNHYTLDKDKDVAFEIGRFYYGIRDYAKALQFYAISSSDVGKHHVTSHNMGLCFYSMGQFLEAKVKFEEALGLNASYEKAASWRDKVIVELDNQKAAAAGGGPAAMVAAVPLEEQPPQVLVQDDASSDEE